MLDLRLPIGYFFIINSLLLLADGLIQPNSVALGGYLFNLDLVWGAVMGVFGLFMAGMAHLGAKKKSST